MLAKLWFPYSKKNTRDFDVKSLGMYIYHCTLNTLVQLLIFKDLFLRYKAKLRCSLRLTSEISSVRHEGM